MPQLPDNIRFLEKDELEMAVLRVAIMSEFDSINTYEQILNLVKEGSLRNELFRILAEDKAHAVRLQELLSERDAPKPTEKIELPDMEEQSYSY